MSRAYEFEVPMGVEVNVVEYMPVAKNVADVFLRKDISTATKQEYRHDEDGESEPYEYQYQKGTEIYFQVDPTEVSKEDIESNFEKYWQRAERWVDLRNVTDKERIATLEAENTMLKQCIVELSGLL